MGLKYGTLMCRIQKPFFVGWAFRVCRVSTRCCLPHAYVTALSLKTKNLLFLLYVVLDKSRLDHPSQQNSNPSCLKSNKFVVFVVVCLLTCFFNIKVTFELKFWWLLQCLSLVKGTTHRYLLKTHWFLYKSLNPPNFASLSLWNLYDLS